MNYMFKDAELAALRLLAEANVLEEHKEKRLYGTVFDMAIGLQRIRTDGKDGCTIETHHYYPRIACSVLKATYREVLKENLVHFQYIANMYGLGLGLPKSGKMAFAWRKWSTKTCPGPDYPSYEWALRKLKHDIKNCIANTDDGYAYYSGYKVKRDVYAQALAPCVQAEEPKSIVKALFGSSRKRKNICVSYKPKGIEATVLYEQSMAGLRLLDVLVKTNNKTLSLLGPAFRPKCKIPSVLSPTDDQYAQRIATLTGTEAKRFAVTGVLCIPKAFYPQCKENRWTNISQVLEAAIEWTRDSPYKDPIGMFDFVATNVYAYDMQENLVKPIGVQHQFKSQHLQGAGFTTLAIPGHDIYRSLYPSDSITVNRIKQDIAKVQKRFKEYRIQAAVFEPADVPELAKEIKRVEFSL